MTPHSSQMSESQNNQESPIDPPSKPMGLPKGVSGNIEGRGIHRRRVEEFEDLSPKEQNAYLRDIWKSVAVGIAHRAKQFATTCSPKDFGKLYQLVQSGAVSIEKAFPPKETLQSPKLIFNLFQSLGQRASRIAIPEVPAIDVTPTKTDPDGQVQDPAH